MAGPLTLIANPGSASRKYALFQGEELLANLHFEHEDNRVAFTLQQGNIVQHTYLDVKELHLVGAHLLRLLRGHGLLADEQSVQAIGLRIVAPSGYFLHDHILNDEVLRKLQELERRAPLHIGVALAELEELRGSFPHVPIVGVSDSAFHRTKPDYAWNYGLPLHIADAHEIKRFGYHGISLASIATQLQAAEKLPPKVIVAHLGSGASVTALHYGKSVDTTMGYSPLEGLIMSTRSGSIDATAVQVLKDALYLSDADLDRYLHTESGLKGLGGSADMRELLAREASGDHQAELALATYIHGVQKAIGEMAAVLGGADMLVFTGTVGERSMPLRKRILSHFHYLDFVIDDTANNDCSEPLEATSISKITRSKPVLVIPTQESLEMARRTLELIGK